MADPRAISPFQGSAITENELMQVANDNIQFYDDSIDVDMVEVDSSEIAAIVCGVPVMISNCEQDIDMRENKPTSFSETNLMKDNANMELDVSVNKKEMIGVSDCEINNKMNQLKDVNLYNVHFENNCTDMELEPSRNEKAIETSGVEIVKELTKSTVAYEVLGRNKANIEIAISNIANEVEEINGTVLFVANSEKDSPTMDVENSESEKTVITSTACKTSFDVGKEQNPNLSELRSKEEPENLELDVSATNKEMNDVSGNTCDTQKQVQKAKFYAVALPRSFFETETSPCIFTSKNDALAAIKKYPGARFMQFDAIEDAMEYSSKPVPLFTAQPLAFEEKPSKYKSISSQQMVALRKAIEKGDEATFLDSVWSNPRYLINNAGDGPTVMQEGTRYNALHVAARFKQSAMCLTILNTIQDHQFMSLLYPQENSQLIDKRISRLVDLYLNTPDKSLSETPLHFACKFGADEILSILLSYQECDIHKKNKYGLTPREMICDRTSHHPEFKEKMNLMFEDVFYVPILRDLQNNIQEPVIGKPCQSNIFLTSTSSEWTYGEKNLVYCAFAGPMPESAADNFYTLLKKRKFTKDLSFTPEEKKQLVDICMSDSEKGLERVGRKLARELNVGWIEFWPALHFWGDLSSEGLELLEKKLKSHFKPEQPFKSLSLMADRCEKLKIDIIDFVNDFVRRFPEILKNKDKTTFFVLFQTLLPYLLCLNKSSFSETKELYMIHNEIGHLLYLKLISAYKEYFEDFKFYLNKQFHTFDNLLKSHARDSWKTFICILKCMCYNQFSSIKSFRPPKCDCNWNIQKKFFYSSYFVHKFISNECRSYEENKASSMHHELPSKGVSPSSIFHMQSNEKENVILVPFQKLSLDVKVTSSGDFVPEREILKSSAFELSQENQSEDIFYLSSDSIEVEDDVNISDISEDKGDDPIHMEDNVSKISCSGDTDDELEGFFTPPESPSFTEQELFVNGIDEFSDIDIDIFRAIVDGGAKINQCEYPYVFEWKCLMESKLKSMLNPRDKLSCTPASSSATVRRAITPIDRVRRTLF